MVWQSPDTLFVAKTATPGEGSWAGLWDADVVMRRYAELTRNLRDGAALRSGEDRGAGCVGPNLGQGSCLLTYRFSTIDCPVNRMTG